MKVLVTGARGFIGRRVMALLGEHGHVASGADLDHSVLSTGFDSRDADAIIHLAAHKYAGMGEEKPEHVAHLNIVGTGNMVRTGARVILASTCKAADPITCYGASKLIAERIALNAGGSVVRLVNVLGSSGSVSELWGDLPPGDPLPVVDAQRMFMSPDEAAALFVRALELPAGRYGPNGRDLIHMAALAARLYPGRAQVAIPLRNGDRPIERLTNEWETTSVIDSQVVQIFDCWHGQAKEQTAAA